MFFWNSLAFSIIQQKLAIWSLVPLPFLNLAWTSGNSWFTYCWRQSWGVSLDRTPHALCCLDLFTYFKNYWWPWSTYLCRFYLLALTLLEWKLTYFSYIYLFIPSGSVVKNLPTIQEMQETWVWSLGWKDPLKEELATNANILAWRIPRTEEPLGSERVGHDWATEHTHSFINNQPIRCEHN